MFSFIYCDWLNALFQFDHLQKQWHSSERVYTFADFAYVSYLIKAHWRLTDVFNFAKLLWQAVAPEDHIGDIFSSFDATMPSIITDAACLVLDHFATWRCPGQNQNLLFQGFNWIEVYMILLSLILYYNILLYLIWLNFEYPTF